MADVSLSIRKSNPSGDESNIMISGIVSDEAIESHVAAITELLTNQMCEPTTPE